MESHEYEMHHQDLRYRGIVRQDGRVQVYMQNHCIDSSKEMEFDSKKERSGWSVLFMPYFISPRRFARLPPPEPGALCVHRRHSRGSQQKRGQADACAGAAHRVQRFPRSCR